MQELDYTSTLARCGEPRSNHDPFGAEILITGPQSTDDWYRFISRERDSAGNLTKSDLNRYVYDAENRLTALKDLSGLNTLATYTYDGAGLRLKKVAGGTTTRYIFSGTLVIGEYENGALAREYIYAGDFLVATHEGTTLKYHHADQLSVRVSTDTAGNILRTFGHYPFGEAWYETGTPDKWKFTSYERDAESGLDYAIFRYDSSGLGRFTTPDLLAGSLIDPQSLNRYAYVLNDPANLVDPLGLCPVCLFIWLAPFSNTGDFDFSQGARGGGGLCTLNGAPFPCWMLQGLINAGAVSLAPPPPWERHKDQEFFPGCWVNPVSDQTWCPRMGDPPWATSLDWFTVSNFFAGGGDFLSGVCGWNDPRWRSCTEIIRELMGTNGVVNQNSTAYSVGQTTGQAVLVTAATAGIASAPGAAAKIAVHPAHHGLYRHLQVTIWQRGVPGSHTIYRFPWWKR